MKKKKTQSAETGVALSPATPPAPIFSPDSEEFRPQPTGEGAVLLKAKTAVTLLIGHRTTVRVDCGFDISLAPGVSTVVVPTADYASRGLIVTRGISGSGRATVLITNVGKEIISISGGQAFAELRATPYFDFWGTHG